MTRHNRSPNTRQAINLITAATYKPLGLGPWIKFRQLPPETQAHYLCEAYLATLRERTLPGAKVEVAAPPVNMMDEFIPTPLREAAQEAANKLHTLTEKKTTRGKYKSRIKLRYTLRAFYAGTGRVIHLTPKSFNIETTQELRDTAAKIACDIASGWCKSETRSDGWVTIRKKA